MVTRGNKASSMACMFFMRSLFFIFNLVLISIGVALFIIGIYGLSSFRDFSAIVPSANIYIAIICVGLFIVLIGIISLWCSTQNAAWLLNIYSLIVFILFLGVFTLSVLLIAKREKFEEAIGTLMKAAVERYPKEQKPIDLMQHTFKCCGVDKYSEWFKTTWSDKKHQVPVSCCKNLASCAHENLDPTNDSKNVDIYQEGCYKIVTSMIESHIVVFSVIIISSSVIILSGSILSLCLSWKIKKQRYQLME